MSDMSGVDFGVGAPDYSALLRQMMLANQGRPPPTSPLMLNGSPIGRPDALPGQFPGLLDTITPEGGATPQGGPQGGERREASAAQPGGIKALLDRLAVLRGAQSAPNLPTMPGQPPQAPPIQASAVKGLLDHLALMRAGQVAPQLPYAAGGQQAGDSNAIGSAGQFGSPAPPAQPAPPAPQRPPPDVIRAALANAQPRPVQTTLEPNAQVTPGVGQFVRPGPPTPSPTQMSPTPTPGAPALAANLPPQGPGQPPPTTQGVPPTSAAGRMGQETGSALDRYFQMVMNLQRQRMLMQMAGGLLGAPTLAEGAGRAFRGGAEALGGQVGPMTNIMAAQAAGQLAKSQGLSDRDVQAAQLQALFGGEKGLNEIFNPTFHGIKDVTGIEHQYRFNPGTGGMSDDEGVHAWAREKLYKGPNGEPASLENAQKLHDARTGRTFYETTDGEVVDPTDPRMNVYHRNQ
jgi:hypothetical protein